MKRLPDDGNRRTMAKEAIIKYLCLVYYDDAQAAALLTSEREALLRETDAYCEALRENGRYVASDIMSFTQPAATIRVHNGSVSICDDTCAAARRLGGFILLEARDLNDAIRVVAGLPTASLGTIEIRPLPELSAANGETEVERRTR